MTRILVVTGKSGGHIFPAVAFLEKLRESAGTVEPLLVLPRQSVARGLESKGFPVRYISIRSIRLRLGAGLPVDIGLFLKGCFESLGLLLAFRPQVVVSFGSLVGIPLVVFSRLLGVKKVVLHEQNVIPGRAQRFASFFAHRAAISFEETRRYLGRDGQKIVFTGNPLRGNITKMGRGAALRYFSLKEEGVTVLIMGGSQGSGAINKAFLRAARSLSARYRFQVIHLTGTADYERVKAEYAEIPLESRVFAFLDSVQYALSAADVAVSRGGATSIAELMYYRVPAIIIPYPYAYQHQAANARILQDKSAAVVIRDSELDSGALERAMEDLIRGPEKREAMRAGYGNFPRFDAGSLLAKVVLAGQE
ncbi:MAG: UDP-N-acetylglucosamine--N-acetylmuramyl-(pentapeptide) pyrophosphoryl-undecaprenol N-acetylglucosamine transferase [Candidatus Omnitrophota bacterium]|jgi:UDP-N-acetylglucosamine--N-acetylmuramyl-(pentapeptide) pyrophosphoryl-undecaprenol N-acetylglucosamine transferase